MYVGCGGQVGTWQGLGGQVGGCGRVFFFAICLKLKSRGILVIFYWSVNEIKPWCSCEF